MTVTIGAAADGGYAHTLGTGSKKHLAGKMFPMYGTRSDVLANENPRIQMRHLSALIALEIENVDEEGDETDVAVKVENFTFTAPEDIAGKFNVDFSSGTPEFDVYNNGDNASNVITVNLKEAVSIQPGSTSTIYFAVKPFEATSGQTLTISINGVTKTLTVPENTTYKLEPSKVTKIKFPIKKLYYPVDSDALSLTYDVPLSENTLPIVTISGSKEIRINGQNVPVYIIGGEKQLGSITLEGFAKDVFNALPIGFYASQWNNNPTAMTVSLIDVEMPIYNDDNYTLSEMVSLGDYKVTVPMDLSVYFEGKNYGSFPFDVDLAVADIGKVMGVSFEDGLTRQALIDAGIIKNLNTITFSNFVPKLGFHNSFDDSNVLIFDEEDTIYKEITNTMVNTFIEKFSTSDKTASFEGISAILNATQSNGTLTFNSDNSKDAAEETAEAIIETIQEILLDKAGEDGKITKTFKKKINLIFTTVEAGATANVPVADVICPYFFKNATDFMHKLRDMKFKIVVENYPYAPPGTYTTHTPETPLQPIVFWGFDANSTLIE